MSFHFKKICTTLALFALANAEVLSTNTSQVKSIRDSEILSKFGNRINGRSSCYHALSGTGGTSELKGCPSEIPIHQDGKIVAGRFYWENGNDRLELACNGGCTTFYAETKRTAPVGQGFDTGSIIINPGCTLVIFRGNNYEGTSKHFTGPKTIAKLTKEDSFNTCDDHKPCIDSSLWTCNQTYPSCEPTDSWETVTQIDNSDSSIDSIFSYAKTVGTTFSQEMKTSMSVSATVSASLSGELFGITASMSVSATTGYDWSKTDTETKSESTTYTVQVTVPPRMMIWIEEAVGTCGDSKFHTQLFRIKDKKNWKNNKNTSRKAEQLHSACKYTGS